MTTAPAWCARNPIKANSFGVSADYLFPSTGPMSFSLGASGDYYSLNGEVKTPTTPSKIKGKGFGGQVRATGSYAFAPEFAGFISFQAFRLVLGTGIRQSFRA